jgi:hypothetical protein
MLDSYRFRHSQARHDTGKLFYKLSGDALHCKLFNVGLGR